MAIRSKNHFREHLGIQVRSTYENNFCLYLNHLGIAWEYEPEKFRFPVERGARVFIPDFYLPDLDIWIEIKGRFTSIDRTKMKRMKKYHPEVFKKMQYVVLKAGTEPDIWYKSIGLKPFVYIDDLKKEFKDVLDNWE
jgi:endonuclease I